MKVFISYNGNKLSANIEEPINPTGERLAVVLPGYLDCKDYLHLEKLAGELTEAGFVSIRFNPTGTWDSEGDIKAYNISQYLKDIKAVIDYQTAENRKPYKEIVILGHSLGAMMGILYGATHQEVSAVVCIMPLQAITKLDESKKGIIEWKKKGKRISVREFPNNKSKTVKFEVPFSFVEDAMKYDVLTVVGKLYKPLLVMAGELDDTTSPAHVMEIYEVATKPKQFILLPDIGHDYRVNNEEVTTINKHVIKFIKEHCL